MTQLPPSEPSDADQPPAVAPPHYGQQPSQYQYQYQYQYPYQAPGTNGLAIASMVVGILWLYWVGSILALIFGYIARGQIRQRQEAGDGMAIAGIVLGWIGIATLVLVIILAVAAGNGFFG
jgi:hypothetical protein